MADLLSQVAADVREIVIGVSEIREEMRIRLALSEADRRTLHAEVDALRARVDALTAAPGAAAIAGWRHVLLLFLTGLAGATLSGVAIVLRGGPHP